MAGETTFAKSYQAVDIKTLDSVDAVTWEQHAVIGTKEAAFVHGGEVEPIAARLEAVVDLRRIDADVVVVVGPPQRMYAVRPEWHAGGGFCRGSAQCFFERYWAAINLRLVAHLDVPARQAGIGAHGAAIFLGNLVVFEHCLQYER